MHDNKMGWLSRREGEKAPYIFMGVQILKPELFSGVSAGKFSLNAIYDKALAAKRLYGLVHKGMWYHLSTPEDLEFANKAFIPGEPKNP